MFKKTTLFIFSLLILVTAITIQARDIKQVKVFIDNKTMLHSLSNMALDIVERGDNYITIITNASELQTIQQNGFRIEIEYEDAVAHYQKQIHGKEFIDKSTSLNDMGGYKTLAEINAAVDTIIADHPSIISNKVVIGQSLEGRDIWAVKISDNPAVEENETEIFYYSATHCREVITPEVLLHFMNYLTDNYGTDSEVTDIVDNRQIWFVLNVNPDGYVHNEVTEPGGGGLWRKNRRNNGDGTFGVDINRNYGYKWGLDNVGSSPTTSSQTYRGTGPFSEPETQVIRDFIEAHNFVITVDYHSYSDLILWPWGYDFIYTEDENIFSLLGDSIAAYNGYAPGPGWTLYLVNGEAGDWEYGEQVTKNKNLAILFEVGSSSDGFWPNPADIPTLVAENLEPNLFLAKIADDIYQRVPPKTPVISVDNPSDSTDYQVNWLLTDTMNPAVEYELLELQGYTVSSDPANNFDRWNNNGFSLSTIEFNNPPMSFYSNSGNNLFSSITTTEPYLVGAFDSILFQVKYDIETDWDYAYVQVSTDGMTFNSISGNITTTSNPNGNNAGNGITGSNGGWSSANFDISSFVGQSIYIRLSYITDGFIVSDGFRVDDFYPVVSFATSNIISSTIVDTFYNFTSKPAGAYHYKVRGKDAENQWSEFSVAQQTIVSSPNCCFVDRGNVDGGADDGTLSGSIDIADLVYLVAFSFQGGPTPICIEEADVNASGGGLPIDIADVVALVAFMFQGGPPPLPCL